MKDFQQFLVPVDFHLHTDTLAEFASAMAAALNAGLVFIHVMRQVPDTSDYRPDSLAFLRQGLLARAQEKMAALLAGQRAAGQTCEGEVVAGEIADSIIAWAMNHPIDLIILSTHGLQGAEKVLLGSVADRVIKGSPCPILVFNPFQGERG